MSGRSRSSLFLIEQLVVIAVFAVCAAVCVSIFVDAFLTAESTSELNNALVTAKNGAECYKASGGLEEVAEALGGQISGGSAAIYYDKNWHICGESEAIYVLRFERAESEETALLCELSVNKTTGEEIISFTVAGGGKHNE